MSEITLSEMKEIRILYEADEFRFIITQDDEPRDPDCIAIPIHAIDYFIASILKVRRDAECSTTK